MCKEIIKLDKAVDLACNEIMGTITKDKLQNLSSAVCVIVSNIMRYKDWLKSNTSE